MNRKATSSSTCSWKEPSSLLLLAVILAYVVLCPYTKVEESFNMQAMHDLLYLRDIIKDYDHLEFSGVVPRSFTGSIVVSVLTAPLVLWSQYVRHIPKIYVQMACRSVLGTLSWLGCVKLHHGIRTKFNKRTANLTLLLLATQFHLPFYMSRPLPNTFALICTLVANSFWLLVRSDTDGFRSNVCETPFCLSSMFRMNR
jgi:alpha-1,6-mannosyltransferase